jgi:polysaccharide export outer membrane protein
VKLRRKDNMFILKLRDIFNKFAPGIPILERDHIFVEETVAQKVKSVSKVDQSGSVVFEGVGKIKARGRSLSDLQNEIEKILGKVPGSQNAFQIGIEEFASQSATVISKKKPTTTSEASFKVPITDTPIKLVEILIKSGLILEADSIAQINLQRNGASYVFTLDHLLDPNIPTLYLQPGDYVTTDIFPYKENKVFILGGVSPQIFKINPATRETLADILFTSGGVLSASSAKRSEVYLLRGSDPVVAYHLDAQSPARLIVADAMELRPNDILYVAEQPLISFNRTLASIVPLRLLLRDIQDENIP